MHYAREISMEKVREAAEKYLSSPTTLELMEWGTGGFSITVFHTIEATYPYEDNGEDSASFFYRERIRFRSYGPDGGYLTLEVVRKRPGRTRGVVLFQTRIGWLAPTDERTREVENCPPRGRTFGRV